ncbi:homeodomain-like transcriptional regulator isoform X2 [Wolffia australiana]
MDELALRKNQKLWLLHFSSHHDAEPEYGLVKKSKSQIEFLEKLFSEKRYPNQKDIEDSAIVLNLTHNQVRTWFTERRKKHTREEKMQKVASSRERTRISKNRGGDEEGTSSLSCLKSFAAKKLKDIGVRHTGQQESLLENFHQIQVLLPTDYILKQVFRKDGPPLGVDFDFCPEKGFRHNSGSLNRPLCCHTSKVIRDRRKGHGIGKGLMTAWCMAKRGHRDEDPKYFHLPNEGYCSLEKSRNVKKITRKDMSRRLKKGKVISSRIKKSMECDLGSPVLTYQEQLKSLKLLIDDEELELAELQTLSNPPRCSAHISSKGRNGCALCKDMLAIFPPPAVRMKQPIRGHPWDSSPEILTKFFKVLCFLYTHATAIDIFSFTLDELAQAFHDKDSMLLGSIHIALLSLLLSDVKRELNDGFFPRGSKDCQFLGFLHSVRQQELDVDFWSESLNPLTWVEIFRQVMISAGFASRKHSTRRNRAETVSAMGTYGLHPHTMKGELFSILSEQGSRGAKVKDLARASQIVELGLGATAAELEAEICGTLSGDCTLFEKIGPSAYRLRKFAVTKHETQDYECDNQCSGSVDYDEDTTGCSSSSDGDEEVSELGQNEKRKGGGLALQSVEIDESFPGAGWLHGLMEGEYSALSIEEKLDGLVALVNLTRSCSILKIQEQATTSSPTTIPKVRRRGPGGKIQVAKAGLSGQGHILKSCPGRGSSQSRSKSKALSSEYESHTLQAISLGQDRRFNGYWLFLGPCSLGDPGHRRIYFESSEDGHWEVIDSPEALMVLMSALDDRGARENLLLAALRQREACLTRAMQDYSPIREQIDADTSSGHSSLSPISDVDNNQSSEDIGSPPPPSAPAPELIWRATEQRQRWARAQAFDHWLWDHFYSELASVRLNRQRQPSEWLARCDACHDLFWPEEKHCGACHATFELGFDLEERFLVHAATCCPKAADSNGSPGHRVLPSQLQVLKAAVHAVEAGMPEDSMVTGWRRSAHKLWVGRLRRVVSVPELFQVVADFVGTVREGWGLRAGLDDDVAVVFQTMPQTTSAFALWLEKLDGLVAPCLPHSSSVPVKRKRGGSSV